MAGRAASGGPARPLGREGSPLLDLALSPDGKSIASGGQDQTVYLWNVETGTSQVFRAHAGQITSVAFSPDGARVALMMDL